MQKSQIYNSIPASPKKDEATQSNKLLIQMIDVSDKVMYDISKKDGAMVREMKKTFAQFQSPVENIKSCLHKLNEILDANQRALDKI